MRKKSLLVVLVLILLGGTLAGALNYTASNDESVTRILGYDVYKIEGSGNYIIYYPPPKRKRQNPQKRKTRLPPNLRESTKARMG